jgi:PAT family acetyl-CoA transporter-like MFS transporter 1
MTGAGGSDVDDKFGKPPHKNRAWADLRGDYANIALLLLLYTLQGVPMGLAASVPLLLQERGASYSQQSLFSLVSWPFSLKLFWAPLVDSYYNPRIGRRRSWLLPAQLLCALLMISSSASIDRYLGGAPLAMAAGHNDMSVSKGTGAGARGGATGAGEGGGEVQPPAVYELTCIFFVLYLLMATQGSCIHTCVYTSCSCFCWSYLYVCTSLTWRCAVYLCVCECMNQDIAVDGWALTMLHRRNVGWASTCNSTGQTLGYTVRYYLKPATRNPQPSTCDATGQTLG